VGKLRCFPLVIPSGAVEELAVAMCDGRIAVILSVAKNLCISGAPPPRKVLRRLFHGDEDADLRLLAFDHSAGARPSVHYGAANLDDGLHKGSG